MPVFAGAADGRFAEHDLEVDILDPWPGPDNIRHVADGDAEFCLTSVTHFLRARRSWGQLAARFAAVVMQRTPIAALVSAASDIDTAAALSGRRLAGPKDGGLVVELQAALAWRGLGPMTLVPMDYAEALAALGRGEVDAVADFVDLVPQMRRRAGVEVRAVPVPVEVYANGLVAADRLPDALAARMHAALAAALLAQRHDPKAGLDALLARFPDVVPDEAVEGWRLAEGSIFTGAAPGGMDLERWCATIAFTASAHDLPAPPPEQVARPTLYKRLH